MHSSAGVSARTAETRVSSLRDQERTRVTRGPNYRAGITAALVAEAAFVAVMMALMGARASISASSKPRWRVLRHV